MELFPTLSNMIAWLAAALGLALAIWWIVGLYSVRPRKLGEEPRESDLPAHKHEFENAVPPVLTIFYLFVVITMVVYVIYIAVGGATY
jgi:hypothetical protein